VSEVTRPTREQLIVALRDLHDSVNGALDSTVRDAASAAYALLAAEDATKVDWSEVLRLEDLRIVIGPGTRVEIYHKPTGLGAVSEDERSTLKNKAVALRDLRSRVARQE
jgi:hypothetical protein